MSAGHEVTRTRSLLWLVKKLPIRAYGLKTMMFDNDPFLHQPTEKQWHKSGAREMHKVRIPQQHHKFMYPRPPNHTERES
jgi:hypothetical protein